MRPTTIRVLVTAAIVLVTAACGAKAGAPPAAMPPLTVGVASPVQATLPTLRETTGRVEAIESVELRPQVSGAVVEVAVADGAEVAAGQLILRIDEASFADAVARAEAAVARAQAQVRQADLLFDRSTRLLADQLTSQQSHDEAETARDAARADLASAQAGLASARLDLARTRVVSPIAGRIGKILATVGNLVQGGTAAQATLLATIHRSDEVYVAFDLDEVVWRQVQPRLRAAAGAPAAVPVRVGLGGEAGFPHAGAVAWASNQVDPASGAIRLRAKVANPERLFTPGAFARVSLEVAPPRQVLLINEQAVQAQLATRYVLAVDASGAGAAVRPVVLGATVDGLRVVESGLKAEDRIAVNNLVMLFPGRPITAVPASMRTLQNDAAPAAPAAPADGKAAK